VAGAAARSQVEQEEEVVPVEATATAKAGLALFTTLFCSQTFGSVDASRAINLTAPGSDNPSSKVRVIVGAAAETAAAYARAPLVSTASTSSSTAR
jgi:hypothetical protein